MTTDKDHSEKPSSRKPQILITEEQFVATERAIVDLLAKRMALDDLEREAVEHSEALRIQKTQIDPLTDEIFDLYADICASPPLDRRTALIKLRLAVIPSLGFDASDEGYGSLLQVSAFLDGGKHAYVPLPSGLSRLQKMIVVEEQIRSLAVRISDAADNFSFWLEKQEQDVRELAGGVDLEEIYRLYHKIDDGVPDTLRNQITNTPPASLAEAIALLELAAPSLDAVIAGLRAIAEKGGVA
jgi:hypothetical protein